MKSTVSTPTDRLSRTGLVFQFPERHFLASTLQQVRHKVSYNLISSLPHGPTYNLLHHMISTSQTSPCISTRMLLCRRHCTGDVLTNF